MKDIKEIAKKLVNGDAPVQLLYAFNSTGKTQLSIAYTQATKNADGTHTGVYYNAYSEDLFVWDNDIEHDEANIRLNVLPSSLSKFHGQLEEEDIRKKLQPYGPSFEFRINKHTEEYEEGIKSISFFPASEKKEPANEKDEDDEMARIKISRGEERMFVWCFFLAMMEMGWSDEQNRHIFIDDPVSSLDDNNIFITASGLYELIEKHFEKRKIVITTHHVGLFAILSNWLMKGEKSDKYDGKIEQFVLDKKDGIPSLKPHKKAVFLYHLRLLQLLKQALDANDIQIHHFALLRQLLESVASFLGSGRFSYALERIGFEDANEIARIVNFLAHKDVYYPQTDLLTEDNLELFKDIYEKLTTQYGFDMQ